MNILALDTSTEHLSLALMVGGKTLTFKVNAGQTHSQLILPQIQALLSSSNLKLADLDGLAFGAGPGSFTGVRIAAGVAQGLGYGANLPVAGVCTLLALAEESGACKVIACLDARMGEVYHAAYEKIEMQWQTVIAPGLYKPEAVPVVVGTNWVGVGSGWKSYKPQFNAIYGEQLQSIDGDLLPTASAILRLALPRFSSDETLPASAALPSYIRNRVALKTAERELGMHL